MAGTKRSSAKPPAELRTIDMFSGLTREESEKLVAEQQRLEETDAKKVRPPMPKPAVYVSREGKDSIAVRLVRPNRSETTWVLPVHAAEAVAQFLEVK